MNLIKTKSFELAVNTRGDKKSEKLAIVCPGRLDSKDYECFNTHLDLLAGKGFYAVCFDPPGTWDSPGGIKLFTTTNYIKAVNELINYYGNRPTFLMGHSRGACVSVLAGSENANVIGLAAIMANYDLPEPPPADIVERGYNLDYRDVPPATSKTKKQKLFKLPTDYFIDLQKHNVRETISKCTKPKLIFYGSDDQLNDPKVVEEVYKQIPEPKMLHKLESDHNYRYYKKIVEEVNRVTREFVDKYLG